MRLKNYKLFVISLLAAVLIFFSGETQSQSTVVEDDESADYYENIVRLYAPSEDGFLGLQRLARPYINKKYWKKAADVFREYKKLFPDMEVRIDNIIRLLLAPSSEVKMVNMGPSINTQEQEYVPVLSPDMKKLYFTGRNREDGIGGEDIYLTYYVQNRWQLARPYAGKINTESNEFINCVSADGNTIVLFGNYENSLGRGDNFYIEKISKRGWSEVLHYPPPINSQWWEADAFLTADGNAIIFSSERPGGVGKYHPKGAYFHGMDWGNLDLWVVLRDGDKWSSQAINLGPVINTPYTERSPFLHPDGKTLYFSSDGHYGLGKSDVFRSVRLSDTSWTMWSEPVNLGKEINTADEEWGYKISTDGKRAYFSTINDMGYGEEDLYYIDLPLEAQPVSDVVTITGKVIDEKGRPVDAVIKWEDMNTLKEVGTAKTDPESGEYFIALPVGKYYAYYADVRGYYSKVNYLDLTDAEGYKELDADVALISVEGLKETGMSIRIENIFFDFDKYDLKEESHGALDLLYKFLKDNPDIFVEINAHTDDIGSDAYNQKLSENRATSVVNHLVGRGIDRSRLFPNGFGENNPVASNETEEGRALNRRVEFRLKNNP